MADPLSQLHLPGRNAAFLACGLCRGRPAHSFCIVKPKGFVTRLVALSAASAWTVVVIASILCAATTQYVVRHFAMTTDTSTLLSPKLPWRVRQSAFDKAFPADDSNLVVVVDGRTPELSEEAAARLAAGLGAQPALFHSVRRPDAGPFFGRTTNCSSHRRPR